MSENKDKSKEAGLSPKEFSEEIAKLEKAAEKSSTLKDLGGLSGAVAEEDTNHMEK